MGFRILLLLCWIVGRGFAQQQLQFTVVDQTSGEKIDHVKVQVFKENSWETTFTDKDGKAQFRTTFSDSVTVKFIHPNYFFVERNFLLKKEADNWSFNVLLMYKKATNLSEVVVRPNGVPEQVVASKLFSVHDFVVLQDGRYLVLTYDKNPKKGCVLQLVDHDRIVHELESYAKFNDLIFDYKGSVHAVNEKEVMGVEINGESITLLPYPRAYYDSHLLPIIDSTEGLYYFSNYKSFVPEFDYFTFSPVKNSSHSTRHIIDEETMVQYRSEYKWVDVRTRMWARDKERETGIDAEMWVGANYYTQSIYYKPLYAPLVLKNDTLLIFDHYKNWLFKHNVEGVALDSLPIYYHLNEKKTGWKKNIIKDEITEKIYVQFEKDGTTTLRGFDVKTGQLSKPIRLHYKYVEHIQVNGNHVYYTYRPFESLQKKYIYREKLPELEFMEEVRLDSK